jgi:hypothetical protein
MSQQNIYHIQLLNDIHNHFPDILYNPSRFHNIQDLLQYIIDVANASPYSRGLTSYNNRQTSPNRTIPRPRVPTYPPVGPIAPPVEPGAAAAAAGAAGGGNTFVAATTVFDELPNNINMRYRIPLGVNNTSPLLNTLLSGMFGDILGASVIGGNGLQSFLDSRVPVYPTAAEIAEATTLHTAVRRQDDICAICQDDIETNQEVRRLNHCNHYFHRNCIDTWFQGNTHCPTCRHDIREVSNDRRSQDNQNAPPPVPDNYRRMNIRRSNGAQ